MPQTTVRFPIPDGQDLSQVSVTCGVNVTDAVTLGKVSVNLTACESANKKEGAARTEVREAQGRIYSLGR